ncbi:MAG: HAMP domain-containing protein [Nitrospirae bacterium]|nr:HAMP domain-containing protein [Nitrospirota bacterium]
MRLLPDTLFGRLVLVLLGGLLLAQLIGAGILLHDRDAALFEAGGRHKAQRIASIVRLLDAVPADQRGTLLAAVNGPDLLVAFGGPPDRPESGGRAAARLKVVLARWLGREHPLWIRVDRPDADTRRPASRRPEPPPGWQPPSPFPPGFGPHVQPGWGPGGGQPGWWGGWDPDVASQTRIEVRTRLADGTWVAFVHHPPEQAEGLPGKALLTVAVLFLAVLAVSLFTVRRVTRPLTMLATAADKLGRDIHRPPLAETGPAEVRRAAAAFNTMQQRIGRYLRDREQMLAAVSHDLKTPITRLRLRAELAGDPAFQDKVRQDLDEMEAMVNATLDFMRGAGGAGEPLRAVNVTALAESIQEDQEELGHAVTVSGQAAPYPARVVALKRCLNNLVENAIRYGGAARVHIADDGHALTIRVADDGPGIPEERLEQVFEPFVRLETSRNRATGGTGLGLAIARTIARAHGGDLILRNRPRGGLDAILTLPR